MTAYVLCGDARSLPLPDASVDLIVTSPPYFGLRSYTDTRDCPKCRDLRANGRDPRQAWPDYQAHWDRDHQPLPYDGQIGSEATPAEFVAALVACTREWVRVLKPEGSIFVNLGDKYNSAASGQNGLGPSSTLGVSKGPGNRIAAERQFLKMNQRRGAASPGMPQKSLLGLPWRYAIACTDQLGLILRAEIVWQKVNGLPESVTDRVRRSHEQVFHFTRQPRYYAAVDEIREPHQFPNQTRSCDKMARGWSHVSDQKQTGLAGPLNPLGKLPGSVWPIPSAPLTVPAHLGIDHFACVDTETEILTQRGWLRHDQLVIGDQVAGYDLDTDTARWTPCTAVSRYDYDGEMVAVQSRDLSMRLTPNHRTIVQRMHTRANKRSPVKVVHADQLDHLHFIPRSAAWERFGDFYVGARLAAVMGWVAAEGWYDGSRVRLSQSLEMNPHNVAEIDRLIPDASRSERKRMYRGRPWTEVVWALGPIATLIKREMPGKLLPWWLVMSTEDERHAVLAAFIDGDGHRRPDGRIAIYQKHRHNLDVLQAVAVTLGYKTTIRQGDRRFVLYLTEGGRSVTLRGTSGIGSKVRREHYTGTVWCPTTGTGTFIARRNGSVFVTGNSFPPALVRPIVLGWSPPGVCVECGQGRRPVVDKPGLLGGDNNTERLVNGRYIASGFNGGQKTWERRMAQPDRITGYVCACPQPTAPTRPALVLDPFAGTGTTMLVASAYGRTGIGVDRSADYCRLARWRTSDPGERARAMDVPKPPLVSPEQAALFDVGER